MDFKPILQELQEKYDKSFDAILVRKNGKLYDTKNWTGEDTPYILFRDEIK